MTYLDALEIVVSRTGHERYRDLCAEDRPGHDAWRAEMLRLAGQPQPPPIPREIPATPAEGTGVKLGGCCP